MICSKKLIKFLSVAAVSGLLAGHSTTPVFAATSESAPITLHNAVTQSLSLPRTLARAKAGGLPGVENADSLRFAPSIQSDVHHAEGSQIPLRDTVGLDATTMTLELSQPIYRSGHSRASAQAQDSQLRAEQADKKLKLQAATLLIINTYLDAQRDAEQLELMRQLKMTSEALREKETNLAFLRQDLQELGDVAVDAPLLPVGAPSSLPRTLQSALATMEDKHPAMAKALYECAAAEAAARSFTWAQEPGLDLRGALDRTVDNFSDTPREDSGTIGLRATIPFIGETEGKSRRLQAREITEHRRLNIDATRLTLRQGVIAAWDALARAHEDVNFQQHKARLAKAGATGALPSTSGLHGDKQNVSTFALLAQRAELAEIKARYDIRKAEFGLLAATGQLLDSLNTLAAAPYWPEAGGIGNMSKESPSQLSATSFQSPLTP